jgi:calcium/calmodulin-dependent protein kinase I
LADFGLSDYETNKNRIFTRCGTPGYVAPEVLNDQPYDCKSDAFSAGVILYILYFKYDFVFILV